MLSGIHGQDQSFLIGLTRIENRITKANAQVTSGTRVSKPSDDPSAVSPMLEYQAQISRLTQTQTNLNLSTSDTSAADSALQSAATILDNIASLGSQGLTLSGTKQTRAILGNQVQQLQAQIVSIANTNVRGNYIFSGDSPGVAPYTTDSSGMNGITQNSYSSSTRVLTDANGLTRPASLTASQIFDTRAISNSNAVLTDAALTANPALDSTANPGIAHTFTFTIQGQTAPLTVAVPGTPGGYTTKASLLSAVQTAIDTTLAAGSPPLAAGSITAVADGAGHLQMKSSSISFSMFDNGADDTAHNSPAGISYYGNPGPDNIFAAVASLSLALQNNDTAGIETAINAVKAGAYHLQSSNAYYGNVQNWIDAANTSAEAQNAALTNSLHLIKDTDLPTAITTMTTSNTALQAAISAHASLSTKTLFDYLG